MSTMDCKFPVGVYRTNGELVLRPCGQCVCCRINYSRQWALRCVHESQMHDENCFITLTYNNENLPEDGSLDKRHFQKFIKDLRRSLEDDEGKTIKPIRFFGCGEYGSMNARPHYHICLFGHDFEDKEVFKYDARKFQKSWTKGFDHTIYISDALAEIWEKGFCTIGDLTLESAAYVARYVTKKITGSSPESLQIQKEKYGDRLKEFALMSRRPGIGKPWFDKYGSDVYPKDFVTVNGKKFRPPRYYDSLCARNDPYDFQEIKERRREKQEIKFPPDREAMSRNRYYENLTKKFERS